MSNLLHLAGASDLERLMPMIAAYHAEENIDVDDAHRRDAVTPLLEGSPHGAIWFIGPRMSPVGYVAVSFGWSIEMGGMDGFIDEIWVRQKVRGRGMGSEAVSLLLKSLKEAGVRALHLELAEGNPAERIYTRAGFRRRGFGLMTWIA
ncbi:MAG: GNAT family N-acetyltransferase [Silicimonas sp.]|nr:GNAT family N-acetyltransferase [Silicimonas sp.]